jgi:hypothetical protein
MTDDAETRRLQERAERIHGKNPFSPEAMAMDTWLEDIREKTGKMQKRMGDLEYLDERMHDA